MQFAAAGREGISMISDETFGAVSGLARAHRRNLTERDQVIADWKKHAKELEAAFAAKCAHVAGLDAYLNAMKRAHPDSTVLADSNKRYTGSGKAGKVKTKGRHIYRAGYEEDRKRGG